MARFKFFCKNIISFIFCFHNSMTKSAETINSIRSKNKSNEITAIPDLLEWLDIKGAIITIDAMGCQREIAEKIINKEADYILALKGNQGTLHKDIVDVFEDDELLKELHVKLYEDADKGHGRIEERRCKAVLMPESLAKEHNWPGLKTIIEISSKRTIGDKVEREKRYYISSIEPNAQLLSESIRSHWAIENSLHYILDISFRDDDSRIRKGNAPQNIGIIKHAALNMLQMYKTKRQSIKRLRKMAGWSINILNDILNVKI